MTTIARGCNLIDDIAHAQAIGCTVEPIRRTGELRFAHPRMARWCVINGRRKDASVALTVWLRKAERA